MNEMPGGLRRIIYTSHAEYLPNAEVAALYATSALRNRADAITGLLLYDGARFLQVIEGEDRVTTATMSRILHDTRHRHVHFVFHAGIAARAFPTWSMTQSTTRPGGEPISFVSQVKQDVAALQDVQLQALFIGFARLAVTHRS